MASYKSLKDQHNLQQLIILDDKGFVTYNSQSNNKQQTSKTHNFYELYQLGKYFFPSQNNQPVIVGIETQSHLIMIRAQITNQGEENLVIMKEGVIANSQQADNS